MTAAVLLELAMRCEREDPSHELDKAILHVLGFTWRGMAYWSADSRWKGPTYFTTSLDAAVTLVPEGHGFMLNSYSYEKWCGVAQDHQNAEGTGFTGPGKASAKGSVNQSLPMMICAAALRARAAMENEVARDACGGWTEAHGGSNGRD